MSNQSEDDTHTVNEWKLFEKLLIAFRDAKENGLQILRGEAIANEALNEVFADDDIEEEGKAAP
jgi:hypothetical protein